MWISWLFLYEDIEFHEISRVRAWFSANWEGIGVSHLLRDDSDDKVLLVLILNGVGTECTTKSWLSHEDMQLVGWLGMSNYDDFIKELFPTGDFNGIRLCIGFHIAKAHWNWWKLGLCCMPAWCIRRVTLLFGWLQVVLVIFNFPPLCYIVVSDCLFCN